MSLFFKRIIDVIFSMIGILIFLLLWIIITFLIKLDSRGPVFYRHLRVGKDGKEFVCFKFRSMRVNSDQNKLVSDPKDDRVTRTGYLLRKTSLDETPQLINVLIGDMSVVGPRPALPSQVKEFSGSDFDKLLVKPGLTGWTQVNGRNSIPYEKRLELDGWYAKNWNLLLDLRILFKTLFVLLKQEGIYDVK
ncbi:MAG: hypothetical protein A3B68_06635 [Candidatus Melainabacteria bacterium RIFCSPHIGHO2_02_FULL_34_12]|nr:MAG: hypothetical protein A3B68_06635 [Candidatus Melainabacteria bacterium RIFCSPHIGHO2_02_FULL_34_12]